VFRLLWYETLLPKEIFRYIRDISILVTVRIIIIIIVVIIIIII
jgi:hypothetical protein